MSVAQQFGHGDIVEFLSKKTKRALATRWNRDSKAINRRVAKRDKIKSEEDEAIRKAREEAESLWREQDKIKQAELKRIAEEERKAQKVCAFHEINET